MRGILNVCAVKAPGYGDRRKAMLGDIAVLTGGTAIFKDLGIQLDAREADRLGPRQEGHASTAKNTTIVGGAGKKEAIDGRAEQIRQEIEITDSEYDREKLQERLAKLAGGVAQINVRCRDRNGNEGAKGSARRRQGSHASGARRRHRPRRRRGTAALRKGAREAGAERRRSSSAREIIRNVLD